jgi:hypothetical protein
MTDPVRMYVTYLDRGRLLPPEVLSPSQSEALLLIRVLLSPGYKDDNGRTVDSVKICNVASTFGTN